MRETVETETFLHTSKRMHFIEDGQTPPHPRSIEILHTSKRMHFIEENLPPLRRAGT